MRQTISIFAEHTRPSLPYHPEACTTHSELAALFRIKAHVELLFSCSSLRCRLSLSQLVSVDSARPSSVSSMANDLTTRRESSASKKDKPRFHLPPFDRGAADRARRTACGVGKARPAYGNVSKHFFSCYLTPVPSKRKIGERK